MPIRGGAVEHCFSGNTGEPGTGLFGVCIAGSPAKKEEAHYLRAYVGTQPDKMEEALSAMRQIIEEMPVSEEQIEHAILSIQKKLRRAVSSGQCVLEFPGERAPWF